MSINKIALLTSGGDAPGMNAAIRAVARTALYYKMEVFGVYRGYQGLIDDEFIKIQPSFVANIIQRGGTVLKTARCKEFYEHSGRIKGFENLKKRDIQGLVVIGGDGSFRGAQALSKEFNINCIGIPGTIDRDIIGTEYTIGFDTAANTGIDAIDKIRDTAESHDRLFIIEVMGRDAGYLALHSAISSGAQELFIPEQHTPLNELIDKISNSEKRKKTVSIIVVGEGYPHAKSEQIAAMIKEKQPDYDIRVCILGHIQRGGSPTAVDRVNASLMGYEAVKALRDNKTNIMIGLMNNKIVHTPFEKVYEKTTPDDTIQEMMKMLRILAT